MARKPGQYNITINIDTQVDSLEEANKQLADIIANESLISKQGNSLKSALKSSSALLEKMIALQENNGKISTSEIKKVTSEYEKIMSTIKLLISTEQTYQTAQQKEIDKTTASIQEKTEELNKLTEAQKRANEEAKKAYQNQTKEGKVSAVKTAITGELDLNSDKGKALNNMLNTKTFDEIAAKADESKKGKTDDEKIEIELAKELNRLISQKIALLKQEGQALIATEQATNKKIQSITDEITNLEKKEKDLTDALKNSEAAVKQLSSTSDELRAGGRTLSQQRDYMINLGVREAEVNNDATKSIKKLTLATAAYQAAKSTLRKIVTNAVKSIQQLDKALTDMSIVTGESRDALYSLVPALTEQAKACGITITEMSALTAEYMKQGRTMKDSIVIASETAKAAKIAGISVADSVQYMTSAINGFNLAVTDAAHVSDVFAKLAAASATDYKDLAIALSKVSAQANTAGMSIEFTTALLAKGIETTQEAPESIGTALKTILARMRELSDYGSVLEDGASVNKVERALAAVGVELRDTNGQFRDMEEIFTELGPKWDSLNTMQQQAIAQAVAGTRQQSRFLAIMQDWERTVELSQTALDSAGASMYQYSQYTQGLEYSITEITTAWQGLTASLVDTDAIKGILNFVSGILEVLTKIMNLGDGFVGGATLVGLAIATIVTGLNRAVLAIRQQTSAQINQLMIMNDLSEEAAIQKLLEEKQLGIEQKILLIAEKKLKTQRQLNKESKKAVAQEKVLGALRKKDGSLNKSRYKELKKIVKENKNIDKLAQGQVQSNREINKWAKEHNIDAAEANKLAKVMYNNQTMVADLNKQDYVTKLATLGIDETEVLLTSQRLKDKGIELTTDQAIQITAMMKNGTLTNAKLLEMGITDEKKRQLILEQAQGKQKGVNLLQIAKEKAAEIGNTIVKTAGAIAKAFASLGPIAGGIAAAAIATTIAAVIGTAVSVKKTNAKQDAVKENQTTIYENKEKKQKIGSLRDEYKMLLDLQDKGMADSEDIERLEEIEEELQEIDSDLVQTGHDLVTAMDAKMSSLDAETEKLILENESNVTDLATDYNAGDFWAQAGLWLAGGPIAAAIWGDDVRDAVNKKQAKDTYGKEENQLALRQAASYRVSQKMVGADEEDIKEASSKVDAIYSQIDWEQFAEDNYKNLEEATNNFKEIITDAAVNISQEDDISDQIDQYNKARQEMLDAGFDEDSQEFKTFTSNFSNLEILKDVGDSVAKLEDAGYSAGQITNLVSSLKSLGATSEAVADMIDTLAASEGDLGEASAKLTKEMINRRDQNNEEDLEYWSKITGMTTQELKEMSPEEFEGLTGEYIDKFANFAANGINSANIDEYRTRVSSSKEQTYDIISELQDDGKLSAESQKYLKENYGELYASAEFQKALKENPTAAITLIKNAQKSSQQQIIDDANTHLSIEEEKQASLMEQWGIDPTTYDTAQGLSEEDRKRIEEAGGDADKIEAQLAENAISIQNAKDAIEDLSDFSLNAEKIDEYSSAWDGLSAQAEHYMEIIEEQGTATLETYQSLATVYDQQAAMVNGKIKDTISTFAKNMNMTEDELMEYFDVIDGQLIPKAEKLNSLEGEYLNYWNDNSEILADYYSQLEEVTDAQEELYEMQRDNALEIQNQAIAAMQARLDAEYEATKTSLDKRQELYDKYFDSLEQEEATEDYENDRQALLNKIAALSTSTDSESLVKLKEAQEALAELDEEQLQSERDLRREAVTENFEKQGEDLDAAYENAMNNVEGLWQEFVNMQKEDQEALFKQYGEEFQNVTALAAEVAAENLSHFLDAVEGRGIMQPDGTVHKYAEGGLVDFTGPAWVDGSKTKPEAFLDPEDTTNIGMLAQGLRAMVGNIFNRDNTSSAELSDVSTLNIEEFNINVGLGSNMIDTGKDIADGFMKAIRELGININKQG